MRTETSSSPSRSTLPTTFHTPNASFGTDDTGCTVRRALPWTAPSRVGSGKEEKDEGRAGFDPFALSSRSGGKKKRAPRKGVRLNAAVDLICVGIAGLAEPKGSFLADVLVYITSNADAWPRDLRAALKAGKDENSLMDTLQAASRSAHSRGYVYRRHSRFRLSSAGIAHVKTIHFGSRGVAEDIKLGLRRAKKARARRHAKVKTIVAPPAENNNNQHAKVDVDNLNEDPDIAAVCSLLSSPLW